MASSTEKRREALRERLVDAAGARIAADGLASLRARDLAADAGCSVGAIYTVFDDLMGVILEANGRTFRDLGAQISAAVAAVDGAPVERLIAMAHRYLDYAVAHPRAWSALFEVDMSVESDIPDWYLDALGGLFALISGPLREMAPDASDERIDVMTRGLFSAVHGIVLLGVQKRISAVPTAHLREMIEFVIRGAADATSS